MVDIGWIGRPFFVKLVPFALRVLQVRSDCGVEIAKVTDYDRFLMISDRL